MIKSDGRFVWYELMTTDADAARAFYVDLVGWGTQDASMPSHAYWLFTAGDAPVAGLMTLPEHTRGAGGTSQWIGYVGVDDVDAVASQVERLGGEVRVPPTDVADVSRFSVFADPQSATLAVAKGLRPRQERPARQGTPGHVGWSPRTKLPQAFWPTFNP